MIHIDGSQGEGGGQVLRTSLTMAILTGQEVMVSNIRANRSKPGLAPQHVTAVKAAAKISGGQLEGAQKGSIEISFKPGELRPGRYSFNIPTAGAATLVLQTIFVPLSLAGRSSTVTISGGTHVSWSPCFHYLDLNWLAVLRRAGYSANLNLDRAGFYPKGGGHITARIYPAEKITPLDLTDRGLLKRIGGISAVANLNLDIAKRQRRQARKQLTARAPIEIRMQSLEAPGSGTVLLLVGEFENSRACYFSLGEPGKPAEQVADEAAFALDDFLDTDGAVDRYLADQLLLPLAVAEGPSRIHTECVTQHLLTNADIIQAFSPMHIQIQGEEGRAGEITIQPE